MAQSGNRDWPHRMAALVDAAVALTRTTPSGKILFARLTDIIEPEWLPPKQRERLWPRVVAAREETTRPIPSAQVKQILRSAWDAPPQDELASLSEVPVAVTPTSQVHQGALHDATKVAVKILRPGLAATVRQDLTLLDGLMAPLGDAFPGLDPAALLAEARERLLDEFDLEHEASTQRHFHRSLRGHPFLSAPAPVLRLSHPGVLVTRWANGTPIGQIKDKTERSRAAHQLIGFILGGIHEGVIHCDPDPRDVLVAPDGRLHLLDFGATATIPEDALWPARAVAQLSVMVARLRVYPPAREVIYGALREGWAARAAPTGDGSS